MQRHAILVLSIAAALSGCAGSITGESESPVAPARPPAGGGTTNRPGAVQPPGTVPAGDPGAPPAAPVCQGPRFGPAPLRRLNRREFDNTVADLLGDTSGAAKSWVADAVDSGFDNDASTLVTTSAHVQQYADTAEKLAATAAAGKLSQFVPCDAAVMGAAACGRQFVDIFGKRAYRRPLATDERARLERVFNDGLEAGGYPAGVRQVIETVLQAPQFLYRMETGAAPAAGETLLTDHEIASRLSYFLWGTMPDARLFAAADAGKLRTYAEVKAEATRMLDDPRARQTVDHFDRQWLELAGLSSADRDPKLFPAAIYNDKVKQSLARGTEAFLGELMLGPGKGDVSELFGADYAVANVHTAPLYGKTATGEAFQRIPVDRTQRSGILTDVGLLTALAKYDHTDIVSRGRFVREKLLCQHLPDPPDSIPELGSLPLNLSTREWFRRHREDPSCAGCHQLMDPIGVGFEHYDPIGRWRTKDRTFDINAEGEIIGAKSVNGKFVGAVELGKKLAASDEVRGCISTQWFRYAFGRQEDLQLDDCTLKTLWEQFAQSNYRLRDLLVAVTQTPAFMNRRNNPSAAGVCQP